MSSKFQLAWLTAVFVFLSISVPPAQAFPWKILTGLGKAAKSAGGAAKAGGAAAKAAGAAKATGAAATKVGVGKAAAATAAGAAAGDAAVGGRAVGSLLDDAAHGSRAAAAGVGVSNEASLGRALGGVTDDAGSGASHLGDAPKPAGVTNPPGLRRGGQRAAQTAPEPEGSGALGHAVDVVDAANTASSVADYAEDAQPEEEGTDWFNFTVGALFIGIVVILLLTKSFKRSGGESLDAVRKVERD